MAYRTYNKKPRKLSTSKAAVDKRSHKYTCLTLRFADVEHHQLVRDAAEASKLPMNAWLIRVTLEAARNELRRTESRDISDEEVLVVDRRFS